MLAVYTLAKIGRPRIIMAIFTWLRQILLMVKPLIRLILLNMTPTTTGIQSSSRGIMGQMGSI